MNSRIPIVHKNKICGRLKCQELLYSEKKSNENNFLEC